MKTIELLAHFETVNDPVSLVELFLNWWSDHSLPQLIFQRKSELLRPTMELLREKIPFSGRQSSAMKFKSSKAKSTSVVVEFYFTNPEYKMIQTNYVSISCPAELAISGESGLTEQTFHGLLAYLGELSPLKDGSIEVSTVIHDPEIWKTGEEVAKLRHNSNWPMLPTWYIFVPSGRGSAIEVFSLDKLSDLRNGCICRMKTNPIAESNFDSHKTAVLSAARRLLA